MKSLIDEDGCDLVTFKSKIDSKKLKYNNQNNKIIKYFLSTLQYYYSDYITNKSKSILDTPSKSIILNYNIVEIEHIYAQNIEDKYKVNDLEEIKHNIGNLALLEKRINISNSNKPFKDKKSGYNNETISMTKELSTLSDWTIDKYRNRLELYKNIASKIFVLD